MTNNRKGGFQTSFIQSCFKSRFIFYYFSIARMMFITLDLTNVSGQTKNRNHLAKNLLILQACYFLRGGGSSSNPGVQSVNKSS